MPYAIAPVDHDALGIAREEKSLGYATTSISAATLEKIPETTMMQALAGQSAGVAMTSGSGRPGARRARRDSRRNVVQRHRDSRSSSSTACRSRPAPTVAATRSAPGRREAVRWISTWRTSRSCRCCKGAAATALYGSRAANGAIIIKTKSGKAGQPLRFNFSTRAPLRHADPRRVHHRLGGGQSRLLLQRQERQPGRLVRAGYRRVRRIRSRRRTGVRTRTAFRRSCSIRSATVRFRDPRADFYQSAPTVEQLAARLGLDGRPGHVHARRRRISTRTASTRPRSSTAST